MSQMPLVSVVIPCYKQAQFLAEAVQSCLDQHYPALEVIVVNDGSPDDTASVAAQFGSRITYIEQANRGASAARNTGIKAARGSYVAFLDSDDVFLPGHIATAVAYLAAHPHVGLVASDALLYDGSRLLGLKSSISGAPRNHADFRTEAVGYYFTPSTGVFRRELALAVGGFDEEVQQGGEEWLFAIQLAHYAALAYLPLPTILYRLHPDSFMHNPAKDATNRHNTRLAAARAVSLPHFGSYPAAMRARLLYYRAATAWHAEPRRESLRYALLATRTAPTELPYALRIIAGVVQRRRKRTATAPLAAPRSGS